ncbi:MAG: methyltransferase domain-containing protein [Robiginitalea sp.]
MQFHKNLIEGVLHCLDTIFNQGAYADRALESLLKQNRRWGSRDRGFVAETVYDLVRWKRLYAEIANVNPPFTQKALYQMIGVWALLKGHSLPAWPEFKGISKRNVKEPHARLLEIRKYRESIPDWLDSLGEQSLGAALWNQELAALNTQAPVVLRTNRLLASPEALAEELQKEGIETDLLEAYPDALQLRQRTNVFRTGSFKKGLFEVQDASSQRVAPFLDAAPGMRVVDACAGAGGKTLHLAALMKNKGQLLALDIYPSKLSELRKRAKRARAYNIETRVIDSSKTVKRLKNSVDRVLIDAPCTGLGVLRRNPDAKWKLQPEFLDKVCTTQQQILRQYSGMLRPGGIMVYATCSILPMENTQQVQAFLQSPEGKDFSLVQETTLLASRDGFDGFYMAQLKRS